MIDLSDCIVLGTIVKLHGVHGKVILLLNFISFDNIQELESVFIEIDGLPVPFFISEYTEKTQSSLILDFEDIDTENKAKELINTKVFVPSRSVNAIPDQLVNAKEYIGYKVMDKNVGFLGILKDIIDIRQNPVLCVLHDKKEILLPAHHEFIVNIDESNKTIHVKTPDGLTKI